MSANTPDLSRRSFLHATATGLAAASLPNRAPAFLQQTNGEQGVIRVGIVGTGRRGQDHMWAMGYWDPNGPVRARKARQTPHKRFDQVEIVAVCDTWDDNRRIGLESVTKQGAKCAEYIDYRQMLENENLDAVLIATPDHMHQPIAMAAIEAGCDVYVEKCMTNSIPEALALAAKLKDSDRILQAGFQHHQDHIFGLARKAIQNGEIGKVHMVQTFMNRGGESGAWIFPQEKNGGPPRETVHWEAFLGGVAPDTDYDPRRYFGWRKYWDYSTGISGDLFSHNLNAVNHLTGLGVPKSVSASGGVYYWKDGRETPDTYSCLMEFPDDDVSLTYQCVLSNSYNGHMTRIMGEEGTIEVDWRLRIYADRFSKKYADALQKGTMQPDVPFVDVTDAAGGLVVGAAPSQLWLGGMGATLTTRPDGEVRDTTRLHHENFWSCVRSRQQPDANVVTALPATIGAHLGTISYREGRRVGWDAENQRVV
jgi:predicted dehydrogenase